MDITPQLHMKGRKRQAIDATVVREVTEEDLALFAGERGKQKPIGIQRLREKHHALARSLASGLSQNEAAYMHGFTPSRVSILKNDPTFTDLVNHYVGDIDLTFAEVNKKAADLGEHALDVLGHRLEESEEDFSKAELLSIATTMMDRTGNGVKSTSEVNVNVNMADRLASARQRVIEQRNANLFEGELKDVTPGE